MSLKEKKEMDKVFKASIRQKDIEKKETLINLIINYPMLWDKSHSDYRDRNLQSVKWTEIADLMNMTVKDVKSMWKYLKDQFRVNFHAICSKKSGQEYVEEQDINLVKWPFFRQLMFLKDVVTRRDTTSNIPFAANNSNQEDGNGDEADALFKGIGKETEVPFEEEIITPDQDENLLEMSDNENVGKEPYHENPTLPTSKDTAKVKGPQDNQDSIPSTSRDTTTSKGPPIHHDLNRSTSQETSKRHPTRASTVNVAKKRKRGSDFVDDVDEEIDKEINKVDRLLAASIVHECERNVAGRTEKFCQYVAELMKLVHVDLQRPCEAAILEVVDKYTELSKQRTDNN